MLSNPSRRAAVYVGGGALLVAWLAAANTARRPDPPVPVPSEHARAEETADLAALQNEGTTLRERLAHAPSPAKTSRNPFSFGAAPAAPTAASRRIAAASIDAAPLGPPPLPLILMGIAEQPSTSGTQRTAILGLRQAPGDGSGDDIYMVTVGQTIAARYSVTAIDIDAIELKDLSTGGLRRLALR